MQLAGNGQGIADALDTRAASQAAFRDGGVDMRFILGSFDAQTRVGLHGLGRAGYRLRRKWLRSLRNIVSDCGGSFTWDGNRSCGAIRWLLRERRRVQAL